MGSRRMFSQRIVSSARFLKMPISSQTLYFHLGMNADDDGVVEAFTVMRMVGCTEDDLKVLDAKGFVKVLNEDLVTYIVDWNENNSIRADRIVYSQYRDLLISAFPELVLIDKKERSDQKSKTDEDAPMSDNGQIIDRQWTDNGPSTDRQTETNGQTMDRPRTDIGQTEDRLSKDKIIQDKLIQINSSQINSSQDNLIQDNESQSVESYELTLNDNECRDVIEFYHQECKNMPKVYYKTDKHFAAIRKCVSIFGFNSVEKAIREAGKNNYLNGNNPNNWIPTFFWLFKPENMQKILSGTYAKRDSPGDGMNEKDLDEWKTMGEAWVNS